MIFEQSFKIGVRDIDSHLRLTNRALLGMFEDVSSAHSDTIGCGIGNIRETGLSWVIMHWKIKVIRRPAYGEKITIKTWVAGMKKLYMFRQYQVVDYEGQTIAIGNSKWVLTNLQSGAIKIPQWIVDGYGIYEKTVFDAYQIEKLKEPECEASYGVEYKVPCSAIDLNGHMNNLYYLDAAADSMDPERYLSGVFDYFEMMYKKESTLGEILKCQVYENDGETLFAFRDEGGRHIHAIVLLKQLLHF